MNKIIYEWYFQNIQYSEESYFKKCQHNFQFCQFALVLFAGNSRPARPGPLLPEPPRLLPTPQGPPNMQQNYNSECLSCSYLLPSPVSPLSFHTTTGNSCNRHPSPQAPLLTKLINVSFLLSLEFFFFFFTHVPTYTLTGRKSSKYYLCETLILSYYGRNTISITKEENTNLIMKLRFFFSS